MQWIGWIIAVAALAALGLVVVRLRDERRMHARLREQHAQAVADIEQLQERQARLVEASARAPLASLATSIARDVDAPLELARGNVELAAGRVEDYRRLVKAYDAAVQYCLQPVEMIFGADRASLDQLVKHVEDARRKLFAARTELERNPALGQLRELLGEANTRLGRPVAVVQSLARFAPAARGEVEAIDLADTVEAALRLLEPAWGERIEVVREYADVARPHCHAAQVAELLLHVLANAGEAIVGTGRVTVRLRMVGARTVEVAVADTGEGVPDDALPFVFDPFFTTRDPARHLGLGLAVAREAVRVHGGTINVRTTPGEGSTFTIGLPVESRAAAAT